MLRRILISLIALGLFSFLTLSAQDAPKPDRLSGVVRSVDKPGMKITMSARNDANVKRIIMYDASTKIMNGEKPGTIDDVLEGMRIVALGKFEGVNLKAANITVRPR